MPYRRYEFHQRISEVWAEYKAMRVAVDYFRRALVASPDLRQGLDETARRKLAVASANLEGTYIIRLFAAFEAALRSFDQARQNDPNRMTQAAVLIDEIGGKNNRVISVDLRNQAHAVRRVRNYWAHETLEDPGSMSIDDARASLQRYLSRLPNEW